MVRDRLNKIFSSKVFYIVFSLLVSIALWLFVELSQNPTAPITIPNVQIVYLNEELLHDKNFVITRKSPETLRLTIECKRELHSKLNASTVYVTVDLANITQVGVSTLSYEIVYPQGVTRNQLTSVTPSVASIIFNVDKMFSKPIPVVGEYKGGTASEDLQSGAVEFNPSTITIYGPEESVSRVARAWVPIMRENLQRTTTEEALPFILQDANGDAIDAELLEGLTASQDTVSVTIPIKMTKDVSLMVELIPGAGASTQNANVTINPPTISITGEPDALRDLNTLTIGTIDLTKFESTTTEEFPIIIPNGFNYQGVTAAYVTVEIIGLKTSHKFVTNLQTVNTPKGMTSTILTPGLDVKIRGPAELVDALLPENISVVADLTDYKEGGASVPVKISILGVAGDIGPIGEYRISVSIVKDTG